MGFRAGERVRVKSGAGVADWYGVVVKRTGDVYDIRIGGSDRQVQVEKARVMPPYKTAMEALPLATASHRLILLGCPQHGDTCADTLLKFCKETGTTLGTIFLEGFDYDAQKGVNTVDLIKYRIKLLKDLRSVCTRVVGLETHDTAPKGLDVIALEKFGNNQRCTVANKVWAELIKSNMSGGVDVVCCGTAHLVKVEENFKDVEPLQGCLKSLELKIAIFAVAETNHGAYKPEGSRSGYLWAFPPIQDDDDEIDGSSESD